MLFLVIDQADSSSISSNDKKPFKTFQSFKFADQGLSK